MDKETEAGEGQGLMVKAQTLPQRSSWGLGGACTHLRRMVPADPTNMGDHNTSPREYLRVRLTAEVRGAMWAAGGRAAPLWQEMQGLGDGPTLTDRGHELTVTPQAHPL